jgi:hypothetical protein
MSEQTGIVVGAPERDDADIIRGLQVRLQAIAQRCGVALMGYGKRLFICGLKDAQRNLWRPIGELADCTYMFTRDSAIYSEVFPRQYVDDTMHEVTEGLAKAMHEFHAGITVREGVICCVVPENPKDLIPGSRWREIGVLSTSGILPFVASMRRPS